LQRNDWEAIKRDLNILPIKGISGIDSKQSIIDVLENLGVVKKKEKVQVEIWGSGKPSREFMWSEDMADASIYVLEQVNFIDCITKENLEVRNTHINIGTGEDCTIKELAELIKNEVGFTGDLVFDVSKPDGTIKKLTDVSKLNGLGWKHKVILEEGVNRLYHWYLNR